MAKRCPSCEVLYINGVRCHETGCPDAWRDEVRECKWCGTEFKPEDREQQFCDDGCYNSFYDVEQYQPEDESEDDGGDIDAVYDLIRDHGFPHEEK